MSLKSLYSASFLSRIKVTKLSGHGFDNLVKQLGSPDPTNPDSQLLAVIELGKLGDVRATEPLIEALKPPYQAALRAHAAQAFWTLIDARAIEPLILSLKRDPYYMVRSYSARALGKLRDVDTSRKAVEPLIEALQNDSFFGVRAEAAEALGAICRDRSSEDCKKAREALEKYRETVGKGKDEREARVRREVELAIEDIKKAVADLRELGSKMSQMDDEERARFWRRSGSKKFSSIVGRLEEAKTHMMIGASVGTKV